MGKRNQWVYLLCQSSNSSNVMDTLVALSGWVLRHGTDWNQHQLSTTRALFVWHNRQIPKLFPIRIELPCLVCDRMRPLLANATESHIQLQGVCRVLIWNQIYYVNERLKIIRRDIDTWKRNHWCVIVFSSWTSKYSIQVWKVLLRVFLTRVTWIDLQCNGHSGTIMMVQIMTT